MKVLVINSGSSLVKYEVFEASDLSIRSSGLLERIGESESRHTNPDLAGTQREQSDSRRDHRNPQDHCQDTCNADQNRRSEQLS